MDSKDKVINDLLSRIATLEYEVERLEKRNKEIYEGFMATTEELCEATKEIERLNNIINELEQWLKSEIKRIEELQNPAKSKIKPYGEEYNNYTLIIGAYDNVLDKLDELKGVDKE